MSKANENRSGYKHTPLGWIPYQWEVKRLGEICPHFKSGFGITSDQIFDKGEYPVYGGNGLRGYTNGFTHNGAYLLIGRQGALCGNILRISGKCYVSEHAIAVQTNGATDLDYLAYKLEYKNLNKLSESSAQPGLAVEKLVRLRVDLPTLDEQKRISAILSNWDEAIAKTQQLIAQLQLRNKGLMQQLLTGKIRLKGFEAEWRKLHADEIFKSVSIKNKAGEQLLSATQDRGIIPRSMLEARVTMPAGDTDSFKLVEKGDFVISLRSFQGGIEYSAYRGLVSPAYTVLKPARQINDSFYKHYFKSYDFIGHLAVAVIGIRDGKQISYEDFSFLKLPYPVIKEQEAIAKVLDEAVREVKLHEEKLNALQVQKKGLMQKLLTGELRIKII